MEFRQRAERYQQIEEYRERPLVAYATSTRTNVGGMLASDAVREFIDQIDAIGEGENELDILLHSTGGDALAAWKLMSLLRERFERLGVLVPYTAFSAATILALGADEIVMHPHASLGPTDPQIHIDHEGQQRRFSFEDVGAFLRFLSEEVNISEQAYLSSIVEHLFEVVDPVAVGRANRASELATDVGERLLKTHMTGAEEKAQAQTIARDLNKSFFAHGDAVSRSRARKLNLQIAEDDPQLEGMIWDAYQGIESHLKLREPFDPLQHFLQNGGKAALQPRAPLNLPPDAPQQVFEAAWQQAIQEVLQEMKQPPTEVEFEHVHAIVESARGSSQFISRGFLTGARHPGGEIQIASTTEQSGWERNGIPSEPDSESDESDYEPEATTDESEATDQEND